MVINRLKQILISAAAVVLLFSCVPSRQFEELKSKQAKCEEDKTNLMNENTELKAKITEQEEQVADLSKRIKALIVDTTTMGNSLRRLTANYDKLDQTYERLLEQMGKVDQGNKDDNKKLMSELQSTKEELQKKEDELRKLELALNTKENNLNNLNADLIKTQTELDAREKRVKELEGVLSRKDSVVKALKDKVAEALLGFKENGLTVEIKNGKVYVSVEERLLFASGSWAVDVKGQEALKKLAKVLETQEGVNILIEGHTDDVPYNGSGNVKDNWDLSVMRATAIVKILTSNSKINPKQLTAAGRSEYLPLDTEKTAEARKKNRRTEIIITPKLDELFQILENN